MQDPLIDSELHRWAEIYRANHICIRSAGMTFERFLQNPEALLQAIIFDQAFPLDADEEHYPLLPAQRRVAARLAAAESLDVLAEQMEAELIAHIDVRQQNDHFIEPLRHHARGVQRETRRLT